MTPNGFILLHRSILKWEWYNDANTARLFIHLLLTVNYVDAKWQGIEIKSGQRIASYGVLSKELNISVQSIRTAIKRLISTGELTHEATSKYGLFTVNNYDKYQTLTDNLTVSQHTTNSQATVNQQQYNNMTIPLTPQVSRE